MRKSVATTYALNALIQPGDCTIFLDLLDCIFATANTLATVGEYAEETEEDLPQERLEKNLVGANEENDHKFFNQIILAAYLLNI